AHVHGHQGSIFQGFETQWRPGCTQLLEGLPTPQQGREIHKKLLSKGDPHGLDARVLVAQPPVASLRALTLSTFSLSLDGFPRRAMIPEKLGSTAWTVEGCSGPVHPVPLVGYSVSCLCAPRIGFKIPRWRAKFQAKNERGMKNIF